MAFCPRTVKLCGMCLGFSVQLTSQACQSRFLCPCEVWSGGSGVDPRAWWEMSQATLLRSSFIVLAVCVCWQTEWRRSVSYLYIPLWYHSLCGPCLSRWKPHCSRLSSFLTSPVSWSASPRRILLHSSAWVKIFSSFPPSAQPQITSVLVYRQSTVVPPASYPPSSADGRVKKSSSCPADSFAFPLPLLIFTSPTYLLSSSGLPLTLILT